MKKHRFTLQVSVLLQYNSSKRTYMDLAPWRCFLYAAMMGVDTHELSEVYTILNRRLNIFINKGVET